MFTTCDTTEIHATFLEKKKTQKHYRRIFSSLFQISVRSCRRRFFCTPVSESVHHRTQEPDDIPFKGHEKLTPLLRLRFLEGIATGRMIEVRQQDSIPVTKGCVHDLANCTSDFRLLERRREIACRHWNDCFPDSGFIPRHNRVEEYFSFWYRSRNSRRARTRFRLYSGVSVSGTHLAHNFLSRFRPEHSERCQEKVRRLLRIPSDTSDHCSHHRACRCSVFRVAHTASRNVDNRFPTFPITTSLREVNKRITAHGGGDGLDNRTDTRDHSLFES